MEIGWVSWWCLMIIMSIVIIGIIGMRRRIINKRLGRRVRSRIRIIGNWLSGLWKGMLFIRVWVWGWWIWVWGWRLWGLLGRRVWGVGLRGFRGVFWGLVCCGFRYFIVFRKEWIGWGNRIWVCCGGWSEFVCYLRGICMIYCLVSKGFFFCL